MIDLSEVTTRARLFESLDQRSGTQSELEAFDKVLWDRLGTDGAVLVTDLSGFTKTTKKHGIVHFLSIFRRFQRSSLPLFNKHGGSLMKQEADDLIGLFERTEDAVAAALDMFQTVWSLNAKCHRDDRIGLSIGIDHGRFLKLADDAFGDPINVAYKLGEDIAKSGEILLSKRAYEGLGGGLAVRSEWIGKIMTTRVGGVEVEYYPVVPVEEPSSQT